MVTNLVTLAPEDDVLRGIRLLLQHRITGAPVVGSDRTYLGMLSERGCLSVLTLTAQEAELVDGRPHPARRFMTTDLLTLSPDTDALEAISTLMERRYSGAPVLAEDGSFLGVFSERYIMKLLIHSAYEQMPSPQVGAFMNTDRGRLIDPETNLVDVAQKFLDTYYRRLPVVKDGQLVGQVSRRDVLAAEHHLAHYVKGRRQALLDHRHEPVLADIWHGDGTAPTTEISHFMDTSAETIEENLDFLGIAQVFKHSNHRRLAVLRDGKLVGQISRRDLLREVLDMLSEEPPRKQPGLFSVPSPTLPTIPS